MLTKSISTQCYPLKPHLQTTPTCFYVTYNMLALWLKLSLSGSIDRSLQKFETNLWPFKMALSTQGLLYCLKIIMLCNEISTVASTCKPFFPRSYSMSCEPKLWYSCNQPKFHIGKESSMRDDDIIPRLSSTPYELLAIPPYLFVTPSTHGKMQPTKDFNKHPMAN